MRNHSFSYSRLPKFTLLESGVGAGNQTQLYLILELFFCYYGKKSPTTIKIIISPEKNWFSQSPLANNDKQIIEL